MPGATKSKVGKDNAAPLLGKYELGRLLGRGTFAKVYHARCLAGGEAVAVKVMDKPELAATGMATRVLREVSAMHRLRHPNVLRLHEVLATRSKVYLVMELAPGGDLLSRLASLPPPRRLPEHSARRAFLQLVSALTYCHARGVSHRDVKPQNVLLDAGGNLKVSDFGLAALPDSLRDDGRLHTACGTPAFAAPEVLRRKPYDGAKADAWSCGVILFVLLAGRLPFDDSSIPEMCRKVHRREYTLPRSVSPQARRLVARLLDPNPATRLAVADIAGHPWFKRSLSLDSQLGGLLAGEPERELAFQTPAQALNAFDIISMSPGLDLSGLVGASNRARERRFMTASSPEKTVERMGMAGGKLGYFMVGKKRADHLPLGGLSGLVAMSVEMSVVAPPVMLVEMRLEGGDGDEAEAFGWEQLRVELGDVVMAWHGSEEF